MAILGGGERDLTIRLFANVKDFTKNMDDATKNTQAFSGKAIETLGKVGLAVGAAAAAVAGFAVKLGVDSVKAAIEAQKQQERLAILLRNTGGATEAQIQTLNAQAIALGSVGVATRDNVTITQSQLATFDLMGGTIAKLTPAILDYVIAEKGAAASTDDFRSMTNGLAQALQGNFASLTATGFVLDEATKATIKNGTETERAAALVEVLNSTYKGFNETIGETAEGQLIRLQNAFEDTKVKIGEALLPFVLELFDAFRIHLLPKIIEFTDFLIDEVVPAIDKFVRPAVKRLVETFGGLAVAFDDTTTAMFETRDGINLFGAVAKEISLSVLNGFLNVVNGLGVALTELTRILGFFFVLFTQFDLAKAIEVLNFEQHKLNDTVGDAQRQFLNYQRQLDVTSNSLANAYRELNFYNSAQRSATTAVTETDAAISALSKTIYTNTTATTASTTAKKAKSKASKDLSDNIDILYNSTKRATSANQKYKTSLDQVRRSFVDLEITKTFAKGAGSVVGNFADDAGDSASLLRLQAIQRNTKLADIQARAFFDIGSAADNLFVQLIEDIQKQGFVDIGLRDVINGLDEFRREQGITNDIISAFDPSITRPRDLTTAEREQFARTVNIYVQGAVADPEGTARAVQQVIQDSNARSGFQQLTPVLGLE